MVILQYGTASGVNSVRCRTNFVSGDQNRIHNRKMSDCVTDNSPSFFSSFSRRFNNQIDSFDQLIHRLVNEMKK